MTHSRANRGDRGQTLPDFAVGIAIFLITITFILVFVPQLTLPFEDQEQPVVAERIASDLSNDLLAERGNASMLNESCTLTFFDRSAGKECPFDDEPLGEQLGVGPQYAVNITVWNVSSDDSRAALLCDEGGSIGPCESGSGLVVGPDPPQNDRSVSTARIRVFVDQTNAVLEVRVW